MSDTLSDNVKVTSSDAPDQTQTHTPMTLPPPPVINEVVVENKLLVQHVQPVAFVPPPAQPPVVQTYYVTPTPSTPSTDVVIPRSSGFVFSIFHQEIGTKSNNNILIISTVSVE